jgi:catechol 2,3-dioxygenase-like lactoylglutathione lyase family enzyme/nitrite reductase/ring-hydroxylating ferredoxin subunit
MGQPGDFHHVVLEVADLERAEQFFADTLELEALGRNLWPEDSPNASFRTGDHQYLVLVEVAEVKPEGPGVHTNFILAPQDYEVVYDRLRDLGALEIDHRAEQRSVGEVSTYFRDPDGHHLQITAFAPEAFLVPPAKKGKVRAGRIEDFPVGSVTHINEGKFYLVRLGEGVLAISEVCTHRQCAVTYQPEHYRFYCPCHYRKFTRTGLQLAVEYDTPPLHVYPIEFVAGEIIVDTDRSIPRTPEQTDKLVPMPDATASMAEG